MAANKEFDTNMDAKILIPGLLESDHAELDELLQDSIAALEAGEAARAFTHLDFFWARLAMHIRAEHLQLFPRVLEVAESLSIDQLPSLLIELRQDHDYFMRELARAIKAMRLLFHFGNAAETFAVVRQLVTGVQERLERHNRLEEELVYTIATEKYFDRLSLQSLASSIRSELDRYPNRFADRQRPT